MAHQTTTVNAHNGDIQMGLWDKIILLYNDAWWKWFKEATAL